MIFLRWEVASVSILPAVVQGSLDLFDACITNPILVVPVSLVETSDTLRKTIQHLCILLKEGLALQVLSCGVVSKWTGSNKGHITLADRNVGPKWSESIVLRKSAFAMRGHELVCKLKDLKLLSK
jgi:hypothetical protein